MSGLVQTITYIRPPTTKGYGTFLISALSFSRLGHCLVFNLQLVGKTDPSDFASDMLNLSRNFATYLSCDNHSNFLVLSLTMCIPKICLAGPRSFMENNFPKSFVKLTIFFVSCLTTNMSSTESKIIKKSPSSYLLTNT